MAKKKKRATKKKATKKKATKKKATKKRATKKKATKKKATKKKATRRKAKVKTAAKRGTAKRSTGKKRATKKKGAKRTPNKAFMRPLKPSSELAEIVGMSSIPRTQAIKKIWSYIKRNSLQNPRNRRNILADTKLRPIFGKPEVTMFELTALVSKHLN